MKLFRCIALPIWLVVAIAAVLPRLLVPNGWMPVAGADGVRIEICSGAGPTTMIMDRSGALHREGEGPVRPPRDPCPFGIASTSVLDLPSVAALPLPPAALSLIAAPILITTRLVAWRATRPPARGPPAFA